MASPFSTLAPVQGVPGPTLAPVPGCPGARAQQLWERSHPACRAGLRRPGKTTESLQTRTTAGGVAPEVQVPGAGGGGGGGGGEGGLGGGGQGQGWRHGGQGD